jgi:hypothetical protein
MKQYFTLIILLLVFSFTAFCQDSAKQQIKFHAGFESLTTHQFYSMYARVSEPGTIKTGRKATTRLPIGFDTVTDNPLMHGAMYAALKTYTTIAGKLQVKADLYGEYRGFSYGAFDKNNMVLFPVIEIRGKDSLQIGKHTFVIEGKTGQFLNERLDEGLMIYNIDLTGTQVRLRYKNTQLAFTVYGDLVNAIGLNIDDLNSVSCERYLKNDSAKLGISWVTVPPPSAQIRYHSYLNVFGNVHYSNGWQLFAQLSFHPLNAGAFDGFFGLSKQIGMVAGIQKEYRQKRLWVSNRTELRYYGLTYNFSHYDRELRYRDSAHDEWGMYANTTGKYLYPLRKFETPFSQWAVFTEYVGYNVFVATTVGECKYELLNKLNTGLNYDINAIFARLGKVFTNPGEKRTSFFVYPFFKAWVRYCPLKEFYFSFFISNKTMNLDVSYPTHYLLKKPFGGIELFCRLP